MLKIDYNIKTNEGVEVVQSEPPDYVREVGGNIVLLEGPGSSGKSTLLNMITLGCFGDKNASISESIKSGIDDLKSDYRELWFDIEISDPVSGTVLRLKRENKNAVEVYENGSNRCMTQREFDSKYKLIYDIPDNPTKRLEEIVKTIREENQLIDDKIECLTSVANNFKKSLNDVLTEVDINIIESEIENRKNENEEASANLSKCKLNITFCKQALLYHKYKKIVKDQTTVSEQLKIERNKPERKKTPSELKSTAYATWEKKANTVKISPSLHNAIVTSKNDELIEALKIVDEIWDGVNLSDVESSRDFIQKITNALAALKSKIPDNSSKQESIRAVNDILSILCRYQSTLSLGEVGSINDLREHLEKFKKDNNLFDYSEIDNGISILIKNAKSLPLALDKYSQSENDPVGPCRDENLIRALIEKNSQLETALTGVKSELIEYNMSIQKLEAEFQRICVALNGTFRILPEDLNRMLSDYKEQEAKINERISENKNYIEANQNKINQYKGMEKPKFYGCSKELGMIIDACRSIRSNIKGSDSKISMITKKNRSEYEHNPESYDAIWNYLGHRLSTVTHMGKTYNVASVNLFDGVKGTIVTEEGRIIRINTMGTGEGQQSYLKGLLATTDDRKIVALFDEVGNMSESILRGVIDDLESIQKEGKLMLGLMIKPKDDPEVRVFGVQRCCSFRLCKSEDMRYLRFMQKPMQIEIRLSSCGHDQQFTERS